MRRITRHDPDYPARLKALPDTPAITVTDGFTDDARRRVAVVGSREALPGSLVFARALAGDLARAGVVVVSGGAIGVDRAAHEGALDAGGATWLVAPHGKDHVSPKQNEDLFARVAASPGSAVVYPFRDDVGCDKLTPRARNGVLVALADEIVVVQAKLKSGSRNAASWARSLGRPVWVLPGPEGVWFAGSAAELARGARPLQASPELFRGPESAPSDKIKEGPSEHVPDPSWSDREKLVFSLLSDTPKHIDDVASRAASGVGVVVTALLTLSLKNVVVEGPDGFFRRKKRGKHPGPLGIDG